MEKTTRPAVRVLPTETYFAMVRQSLAENGQAFVRVTGSSMQPLLRHLRDGVILAPPGKIRRGDIVLYDRQNGRYALHRVIRVKDGRFTMAGDNQWHVERDLPLDRVIGVATHIVRKGKQIPVEKFFLKIHTFAVTALTLPRINVRRGLGRLVRPFRHPKS